MEVLLTTTPETPWITASTDDVTLKCEEQCGENTLSINIPKGVAVTVRKDHGSRTDVLGFR
jgi:hypothetical protein